MENGSQLVKNCLIASGGWPCVVGIHFLEIHPYIRRLLELREQNERAPHKRIVTYSSV